MSIDIMQEDLVRLKDVPKLKFMPLGPTGKKINITTIHRWVLGGTGGVKLEAIKVGGGLCTTVEALQRFFEELTRRQNGDPAHPSQSAFQPATQQLQQPGVQQKPAYFFYAKKKRKGDKPKQTMAEAMKDPSLAHLPPSTRRRHLQATLELEAAGW